MAHSANCEAPCTLLSGSEGNDLYKSIALEFDFHTGTLRPMVRPNPDGSCPFQPQ